MNTAEAMTRGVRSSWGEYEERRESKNGGDSGIRTRDLCDANAALSQLSYIPTDSQYASVL